MFAFACTEELQLSLDYLHALFLLLPGFSNWKAVICLNLKMRNPVPGHPQLRNAVRRFYYYTRLSVSRLQSVATGTVTQRTFWSAFPLLWPTITPLTHFAVSILHCTQLKRSDITHQVSPTESPVVFHFITVPRTHCRRHHKASMTYSWHIIVFNQL